MVPEQPQPPGPLAQQRGRRGAPRRDGQRAGLDAVAGLFDPRDEIGQPAGAHALGVAERRRTSSRTISPGGSAKPSCAGTTTATGAPPPPACGGVSRTQPKLRHLGRSGSSEFRYV
jgi:hypothetical protein